MYFVSFEMSYHIYVVSDRIRLACFAIAGPAGACASKTKATVKAEVNQDEKVQPNVTLRSP